MGKDMRTAVTIVLVCGVLWLFAGAFLVHSILPESGRGWMGSILLFMGCFAVGYGLGGVGGYKEHKKENPNE